jgi:hypothetical protein
MESINIKSKLQRPVASPVFFAGHLHYLMKAPSSEYAPLRVQERAGSNTWSVSRKVFFAFLGLFVVFGAVFWSSQPTALASPADSGMVSIILTADSGSMVGTSEGEEVSAVTLQTGSTS